MALYRLLMLATRYAIPPDSGYATDVHGAVEQLVRDGVDVRVLLVDDGKAQRSAYPEALHTGTVSLTPLRSSAALLRAFATGRPFVACKWNLPEVVDRACRLHASWPFELVQAGGTFHAANAIEIGRRCGAKVVIRSQNVEHAICQRMADALPAGWRRAIWTREARLLREAEAAWCRAADLCLAISDEDRADLQALAPATPMVTVQSGANSQVASVRPDARAVVPPDFFHVGSLEWAPRREGLLWLLREVWPLVRARLPAARLLVAGTLSEARRGELASWGDAGVEVLGFVPDLAALAEGCAGMVVPMRCGGGIKIRVITAWTAGWPVVGTTGLGEGLPARTEGNCLMADEPEALADAMRRLALDANLRGRLIEAGMVTSREHFSWDAVGRALRQAHLACLENA
jgi:glycosyltransferase involved in cell wall biosynthesis